MDSRVETGQLPSTFSHISNFCDVLVHILEFSTKNALTTH